MFIYIVYRAELKIAEGERHLVRMYSVADPGFPVGGGVDLIRGAVDPRGSYVSKILHVKTKESGPVGGGARRARPPLDPPMVLVTFHNISALI